MATPSWQAFQPQHASRALSGARELQHPAGPKLCPQVHTTVARYRKRLFAGRAMVSALAQGRGLAHLSSGCSQTPRKLHCSGGFAGRPLVPHLTQMSRTHRQKDVVVAVAAKPVPTMVTETPKVKEVKESESSKHDLTPEVAADIYKDMQLGRIFEDRCAEMYYRGKMFGFVHLYSGQEAVSTGVIRNLRRDDYICSTYRDHVHALSKDVPAREIMAELFGKKTGICRGQGGSMHMFSSKYNLLGGFAFIGEGIPIGLGAAFQIKYRKEVLGEEDADQVAVNFFGDGTCNVGQFYECMNMASLYKLPCIFVVENNKWAIGMYHPRATGPTEGDNEPFIYKKGPAFGMPGVLVDGMDVMKVREVALEAIARARRGDGPTLIEAETYRFRGHSLADPDELRKKEEKDHYQARDPIPQFRNFVLKQSILSEAQIKDIDAEVEAIVDDAVKFADESPKPEKGQLLENVFADPKGFGIAPDGRYRYEQPGFSSGTAAVS